MYPETRRRAPAIVVVHDAFGFTDWARDVADQFAKRGYVAIVPDLLSGKGVFGGMYAARTAITGLRTEAVMKDLDAAADYVRRLPAANGRVSVVGFSWGGDQAFRFAAHRRGLRAAYVFYGRPPPNPGAVKAPVFGFYGGRDTQIDPKLAETVAIMRAAGKRFEPVTYPDAGHGFMRFGEDPVGRLADRDAREMAWNRLQRLFRKIR